MYRKLQGTHLGGHVDSHDAAILLLKFSVMIGNAGNADGHFGAIFLQNWEVQCTGKLQVAHLRGHVDSHNGEIGLLKFSIMIGNAGSADGQNGQFGAILPGNWEVHAHKNYRGHLSGTLWTHTMQKLHCENLL